jgi:hypothetical protein
LGLEAICQARFDGAAARGKAQLETTDLLFRAESGAFRARVPLAEVKAVTVAGAALTVKWPGGTLVLTLGPAAEKWAQKIKNPPSRLDKLGVQPGARVALVGRFDFDSTFEDEVAAKASLASPSSKAGVALLFYAPVAPPDLERIPALAKRLDPAGALWVIRPKGKQTAVTESATRAAGLAAGLVDVKVAAFSATHTAEKFVIPVAKRR